MGKVSELSEKAKEAKRAYQRKWTRANPERTAQYFVNFWEKQVSVNNKGKTDNEQI